MPLCLNGMICYALLIYLIKLGLVAASISGIFLVIHHIHSFLRFRTVHSFKEAKIDDDMAYNTPSPSDSTWSNTFSDCDHAEQGQSAGWGSHHIDLPATPPMPFATIANLQRFSVTSAPKAHTMSPTSSPTSSTCTVMSTASAPTARGRRYAKDDDWMRHRARITDLYKVQTLKYVMKTMEDKHNFVATERMYKARFKEWGAGKNMTATQLGNMAKKVQDNWEKHIPYLDGSSKTTVLDVIGDLDPTEVKRAQKYMKRKPVGLKKLRADPKRPLDIIKALSVDSGKGHMGGRPKVSIPTAKLEYQQPHTPLHLMSPPSDTMMPWSPRDGALVMDGVSDEMTRLIQTAVDQEFNIAYSYACSPMTPTPTHWQSLDQSANQLMSSAMPAAIENLQAPDQMMLDFVHKFRIAHILLDDGLTAQAFEVVNLCMSILTTRLHQSQGSDSRAAGTVILYALTAALEMSINFSRLDVLHMLFQHINNVCGESQPRMAEIARRMPQLSRMQQIPTLKLARMVMSRTAVGYSGRDNPSYEAYSKTVDISISHESAEEKVRQLQVYLVEPLVQRMPLMVAWMEKRISLAMCDASLASQQGAFWNGPSPVATGFPQGGKITAVIKHSLERVEWHKMVGNWAVVEPWAAELAWLAELVYGPDDVLSRKLRASAESVKSPMLTHSPHEGYKSDAEMTPVSGPMSVSLPSVHTLHASMSFPEMRGFKQEIHEAASSPSWDQTQGHFHDTTLPSLWNATGGVMDGLSGASLYDASSSF